MTRSAGGKGQLERLVEAIMRGARRQDGCRHVMTTFPIQPYTKKELALLYFPSATSPRGSQPPHVVDPPLQTHPRCPRRPRLSEDNHMALAMRSKAHNGIPGGTLAAEPQC